MAEKSDVGFVNVPNFEEIERAWTHVTRSTRKEVKDWLALEIYGHPSHTAMYLSFILEKLQQGQYEPTDSFAFYRPKKDRSLRRFEFLNMDDRIVFQYLCNRLITSSFETIADLHSSKRVFGNIPLNPNRKSDWLFERPFSLRINGFVLANGQYDLFRNQVLSSFDELARQKAQGWLVRTDIRSYYYSVDHRHLFDLIEKHDWLPNAADKDLLGKCLQRWMPNKEKGIPVGYECSDYIGNLYLNDLDETLKDYRAHRYVDDTYIFVHDFEDVKHVLFKIDNVLETLGLQRNTSKTKTYRIAQLPREELKSMLKESLSAVAEKRQDAVAESKRQKRLRAILLKAFDPKRASEAEDDSFADFRNVAFVLNRITHQEAYVKDTAYYVLDHDLEHSYHALKYLTTYAPDDRLTEKLKSIVEADYEPRSLKALAIYCLQKLCDPDVNSAIQSIVETNDAGDWHLIRTILKQVIEPSRDLCSNALLDSLLAYDNPHVEVYIRRLTFEQVVDTSTKVELVSDLLASNIDIVKKLGFHLAVRDGLLERLDASSIEPLFRTMLPEKILSDIDNFRDKFSKVFEIELPQEYPLSIYFGNMSNAASIMRVLFATMNQGATQFVTHLYSLLEILVVNKASLENTGAKLSDIDSALEILDDIGLYLLVSTLRGEISKDFAKEGIQNELIERFNGGFPSWFGDGLLMKAEENHVRNQAFICYARADEDWVQLLLDHWQPIEDYHETFDIWSDAKIETGDHWREEIMNALAKANIAVLFVSRPFLASRFIHKVELPEILKGEEKRKLKVIWLPVSPSNVDVTPIAAFEAAWRNPEYTLVDMNEGDKDRHLVLVSKKIAKEMGIDLKPSALDSTISSPA